jgi:CRISPR-associated endonuclease/helicase Cas3
MTEPTMLLQFWGKTPRPGEPVDHYHPAIYHMLDVAYVAETLLRDGAPRLRQALLHAWKGCDPDLLVAWLPFLIATHDLGKISAAFQGQAKSADTQAQRNRLQGLGINFVTSSLDLYHADVSALWLHEALVQQEPGVSRNLMWVLRDAMGGHHGRFADAMSGIRKRLVVSERSERRWNQWRRDTYLLLRSLLAPSGALAALGAPQSVRPATAALTGFIVWCDWMGSNEQDFPASRAIPVEEYPALSRQRAQIALERHRLRFERPAPVYSGYADLFADPPRPLQELVDALPANMLAEPLLVVIEAPTGEGKTEAALALARRIAAQQGIDEIFFALPTLATGNQMFLRLEKFYTDLYADQGAVRLTHGQALVVEEDLRRRLTFAPDNDSSDPDGRSADTALEWFVGPKKGMLAPFGVGTVDQVELAGLNVRHYALRLFGLAGKTIVIDEVHAYDAYMSTILEHTLTWLARMGCSIILLSATLPAARHNALAAAFREGLEANQQTMSIGDRPYPAVSLYTAKMQHHASCAVFRGEQRFTIRLAEWRDPIAEATYLMELVREGGAVARLCNRVDDAQAIYRELLRQQGTTPNSHVLLHARFPLKERQRLEQKIDALIGRQSERGSTDSLIIIGTQVLEQSLDYDVDVMVSDFAPIDLLLQRAGRLHRHKRTGRRPLHHARPVMEVLAPQKSGRPDWDRWAPIYSPYILWRSWNEIQQRLDGEHCMIVLPRDYRPLIEAVYSPITTTSLSSDIADAIISAETDFERKTQDAQAQARRVLAPEPLSNDSITEHGGIDFVDEESGSAANWQLAKTRLGDRITVAPVYRVDGRLCLDRTGTMQLSSDTTPDLDLQKEILNYAIPISDRRIIAAYRDERRSRDLQWPWRNPPALLRSVYPLPLDHNHTYTFDNGRSVRLDKVLGLVIEKLDTQRGIVIEEEL